MISNSSVDSRSLKRKTQLCSLTLYTKDIKIEQHMSEKKFPIDLTKYFSDRTHRFWGAVWKTDEQRAELRILKKLRKKVAMCFWIIE